MTRKDFTLIARAFRMSRPIAGEADSDAAVALTQWHACVETMRDQLVRECANFDAVRFLAACRD